MVKIDWWRREEKYSDCEIDVFFVPSKCEYRGNIYKKGKIVGDYTADNSFELENLFAGIFSGR